MKIISIYLVTATVAVIALFQQCSSAQNNSLKMDTIKKNNPVYSNTDTSKVTMSEEEWKKILPQDVFNIARMKGTERPWTSKFVQKDTFGEKIKETGTYYCAACGNALFKSDTKFESGCGWPSFFEASSKESIIYTPDNTHGMNRTEVQCGRCKSHLGHLFDDGPPPTGLRYCINGVVLDFSKETGGEKSKEAEKNHKEPPPK